MRRPPRLRFGLRRKVNTGEQRILSGNGGVVSPSLDAVVATDWKGGSPLSILPRLEGAGGFEMEFRALLLIRTMRRRRKSSEGTEGSCFV